ncbi:fatty acid desaturase [Elizabethkingia meningoseptica]|uniref:Stearoyl-CoA 9-desaturase n=2 Tax=Weeksellaceae TaxID=2762318 RepID=A0A1V3U025_ELIME|nr:MULTISPECIES: fatty acid desaturase [Elizabethkingia]AQX04732.1 stearoyl-CoA 9-desaturase [Elizabethkingia meningoseptica]AQX12194.1 stearoyl-CoA 9-desaturase [Elizabethkingia meningoseptica]AQX46774.1 stearoyl-CoA 9-desaturase [Elizabethkingia meningoseptica]EJK5328310.1 fatty acid desaturase [Elizabethkingia meningoseptica]EOR31250.1 fatty acid desaturase [Elizabethkingia meningoseptica ATCC 13253 = NBRC 12535]
MKHPVYPKNTDETHLFNELRKRVNQRVQEIPENRDRYIRIKAVILPIVYFGSYFLAVFNGDKPWLYIACYIMMGLTLVLIYLNLIHEAAHNNIYKTKKYNKWLLRLFDLIGANSYIWQKRHIVSHHAYPNVDGWDTDMEQSGPIKIFPHVEAKGVQKYQDKYFIFAYPFYLFNWMLVRDFRDFFDKRRVIYKAHGESPAAEKVKMIMYKLFYLFYQIAVPVLFMKVSFGLAFGAWVLEIFVASIFALFVLLPLHPLPDNEYPLPDENNNLPYSWLRHQLEVTNDLSNNNWFIRHILGNFNFHIAHHLFPNYSYVYYNEITDEIENFARENGFVYKRFPILTALGKHYQLLKYNAHNVPLKYVFEELDS